MGFIAEIVKKTDTCWKYELIQFSLTMHKNPHYGMEIFVTRNNYGLFQEYMIISAKCPGHIVLKNWASRERLFVHQTIVGIVFSHWCFNYIAFQIASYYTALVNQKEVQFKCGCQQLSATLFINMNLLVENVNLRHWLYICLHFCTRVCTKKPAQTIEIFFPFRVPCQIRRASKGDYNIWA